MSPKDEVKTDAKPADETKPKTAAKPKDEVKADMRQEKSALERKADALEKAGGDPAKVAELRHQAPAVRTQALKSTAEQSPSSAPTVRDDEEYAERKAEEAEKVSEEDIAKGKAHPGKNLAATRGQLGG